ncbi:hypothetical protein BDV96DRAFT_482017 [Lophiotrema nucula]|uniref:Homeobox domain-containing protein n=1 Tax=Lophiotrema nucula TaxID=690887 RepID=A0A6A5ZTQ2_9PLEO|nr:hypothetical protein BDV96DRAFT_482017 [Lophiotrema nucula]
MADHPVAPSSSPTSSRSTGRRSSPITGLAFLVHSPQSVANNLPPDVDNKPLARQRRRRTSKEDEEILKTEYLKNPKPDKAARIEIVSKVALGEKEVQIWFQNKRQNDRRRQRPLDDSSDPLLMSSSSNMSDPLAEDDNVRDEHEAEIDAEQNEEALATEEVASKLTETSEEVIVKEDTPQNNEEAKEDSQDSTESATVPSTDPQTVDTAPTEMGSSQQDPPASQDASQPRRSWLADRRSASFRYSEEEFSAEAAIFPPPALPAAESATSTRTLKRAHSFVRLSMTADGKARVVTDADKSPSPPQIQAEPSTFARTAGGLRRSFSAAGLNERLIAASRDEPVPKIPRTGSNIGRSRDSRAWEFWCDPDSRNNRSLTTQAEQEGSGSAVDAIGLLRANRRVLIQNQARQNALARHDSSKVLGEQGVKKPRAPMQRASTTFGRLQTKEGKKKDGSDSDEIPQTESDKENWEPDVPQSRRAKPQHAPLGSQRPRQILGENTEIMSQSSSLGAMLAKEGVKGTPKRNRENQDPEKDDELRTFMSGGGSASLSTAEEAGCVEGLLKLSQGNWR